MTEKANFQWQNQHLLYTIYPLREMKLRDFLVYFHEFEIWEAYREKRMDDPEIKAEVKALERARQAEGRKIHAEYHRQLEFFLGLELDYGQCDKDIPIMDKYTLKVIAERRSFQRNFLNYTSTRKQGFYLDGYIMRLEGSQTILKTEMEKFRRNLRNFRATDPENRKIPVWEKELQIHGNTEKLVSAELDHLYRFYGYFNKIKADLQLILNAVHGGAPRDERSQTALKQHDPEAVLAFLETRRPAARIDIKDIVLWKIEDYKRWLEEKNQDDLLRLIVNRFLDEPAKYPLWLQYMVVHFSGMRYKSAHGSWGDPKDILMALKINSIHDKLKNDREDILRAEAIFEAGLLRSLPDADSREKQRQIASLESDNLYVQRATLQDVWIEKKKLMIESMDEEQVLRELEEMSDRLPKWMWKEIVARTDLRLAHAGENWEELTEADKEGYYERANAEFRDILVRWKSQNLTMWREEHARANRLIVTRAVCNEVAEHIQHLRGISPPGGLTAKPLWYRNEEKSASSANGSDRPYFRKIRQPADFKPGASILWLRWVNGKPNIWRITRPLELEGGEGLLPSDLIKSHGLRELRAQKKTLKDGGKVSWVHELEVNAYRRRRFTASLEPKPNNPKMKRWVVSDLPDEQWLRWMHEATVVATGETAEGPVVLTFETALPYEDPHRSTIGVFKRYASHLYYNVNQDNLNGTFVGYVPADETPLEDIKVMLDWRKIVPDMLLAQKRIDKYWQAVEESLAMDDSDDQAVDQPHVLAGETTSWVEAAPPFESKKDEAVLCYRLSPDNRRPGKFKDEVVRPRIEIRRGIQFEVSDKDKKVAGSDTYLRVVRCAAEPNAAGKYVRASEVLELPQNKRSMPVSVAGLVNIRTLNKINAKGKAVLLPSGIKLVEDTMVRVSVVHHKVSDSGKGPGQIDTDGREDYYLIVECPSRLVAEGLFIAVTAVKPVTEEQYEAGKLSGAPGLVPGAPVRARVAPEDDGEAATLFKTQAGTPSDSPEFDRVWQTLPKGAEIEIGEIVLTKGGKVFYPVLSYEADPDLEDFYIRRKEITILPSAKPAAAPADTPVLTDRDLPVSF